VTPLALGTFNVNANGSLLGELGELLGSGATRLDVSG
jgi:hypothetical protein